MYKLQAQQNLALLLRVRDWLKNVKLLNLRGGKVTSYSFLEGFIEKEFKDFSFYRQREPTGLDVQWRFY